MNKPDIIHIDFLNNNHEVIARFRIVDDPISRAMVHTVQIPNDYLVSAGQPFEALVRLRHVRPRPQHDLPEAPLQVYAAIREYVPQTWDCSIVPSNRPLWSIFGDAMRHFDRFPGHGDDCSCMDEVIREIKAQISRAIPPDAGKPEDIARRLHGKARVRYILGVITRWL